MIEAAVVDASIAVKWLVEEIDSGNAEALSTATLFAPDLLPLECGNVLWRKVRLGQLSVAGAIDRLERLRSAPVQLTATGSLADAALRLALELDHPIYDCVYLALAAVKRVALVTADKSFARLARARTTAIKVLTLDQIR